MIDKKLSFRYLRHMLINGIDDAEALHQRAVSYWFGEGVFTDESKAIELWRKAAERGHQKAAYNLGSSLSNTRTTEALDWLRKSAEQSYAPAQYLLAFLYIREGYEHSHSADIITLFRQAAFGGITKALYLLGSFYKAGTGVDQDDVEAKRWFDLAEAAAK